MTKAAPDLRFVVALLVAVGGWDPVGCWFCHLPEGGQAFPIYGVKGTWDHDDTGYEPDPEEPGCGTYRWCPECGQ